MTMGGIADIRRRFSNRKTIESTETAHPKDWQSFEQELSSARNKK